VAWAEGTLLSTSGFVAALGTLPRDPAVQSQITAQLDRQLQRASRAHGTLASRLADITERQVVARAVPAIVSSPAFLRLWRTALNGAHSQLLLIPRGRSHLLTITGSALTVNVPVAGRTLLNASGLPRQLGRLLPAATPVSVTVLNRPALGQARTAVRLTDTLSRILLPADLAVALAGLAAARRRRRALLSVLIPVAALAIFGALGVHLLTHAASSPLATAATSALTAPLTGQLELTSALCAAAVALLLTAPRLVPRRDSGTSESGDSPISAARIAAAGESGSSSRTRMLTADARAASGPRSSESFRAISPSAVPPGRPPARRPPLGRGARRSPRPAR